jgi:hypothetical protein
MRTAAARCAKVTRGAASGKRSRASSLRVTALVLAQCASPLLVVALLTGERLLMGAMNSVKVQIVSLPNDWRCEAGHGFDKPGGSGTTGRRYFKDDDGSYWHEVRVRRYKGGYAMSTMPTTYTREVIRDGTKTLELLDADRVTVLATKSGIDPERSRARWSHETYALLKQAGRV